jgi:hypothetical protein
MAWRTDPVGLRAELVALMAHGRVPVNELTALFGVSRKTAYNVHFRGLIRPRKQHGPIVLPMSPV